MKLSCKLCGYEINSARPGAKAITSVIDQLMQHSAYVHKEDAAELALAIAAFSGYLAVRMLGILPDEEKELRALVTETERQLFAIISGDVVTGLSHVMMEKPRGGQGGTN